MFKNMNRTLISILVLALLFGCTGQHPPLPKPKNPINRAWLDSIIKASDSTYSKPYKRTDFATAVYYLNKKDSTVCQLMKDSADSIRQIIIAKNNIRTYFAQFYQNGQLQAYLPLDEFGQHHGTGTFYYQDGNIQSTGKFTHGIKTGEWKTFDENGKLTETVKFDENGQVVEQAPQ
jgi:antitoxin component YwqK of YwqJK toxin-antitoxin module